MIDSHKLQYEKFSDLLDEKQNKKDDLDIKSFIHNLKNKPVNIGYAKNTLENSFGFSLGKKFQKGRSFQDMHSKADAALITGQVWEDEKYTHAGALKLIESHSQDDVDNIIFYEQGFISSAGSWVHSFENNEVKTSCLSYMFDDMAYYYMSERKNRLSNKLNSDCRMSLSESDRARKLLDVIVKNKISKYNSQTIKPVNIGINRNKVLVIDQSFRDASTVQGLADESVFEDMLTCAIRENPNSDIIVKCHPDSIYTKGKKGKDRLGFYSHLSSEGRVYVYTEAVNPYCLFDIVDKVYVGTSGVGFEALMAGKQVICFGAPFYAGWGVTDDRQFIPHRDRKRSIQELFHYVYIWYTHYHRPDKGDCEIEDVINYVLSERTCKIIEEISNPKLSIIIPVYNVQDYLPECLGSIQKQTETSYEVILINDASTDNSKKVIEKYADEDSRIKLIDLKENIGQGFCRNIGIEQAIGKYILFLDSDDYFESNLFFEKMVKISIDNSDCDMLRYRKAFERVENSQGKLIRNRPDITENKITQTDIITKYYDSEELVYSRHFCLYLYRREFLLKNEIKFITTQWEERPFVIKSLVRSRSIYISDVNGFVYRIRRNSTARRKRNATDLRNQIANAKFVFEQVYDSKKHYIFEFEKFINIITGKRSAEVLLREFGSIDNEGLYSVFYDLLIDVEFEFKDYVANKFCDSSLERKSWFYLILQLTKSGNKDLLLSILYKEKLSFYELYEIALNESDASLISAVTYYLKYNQNNIDYTTSAGGFLDRNINVIIHPGTTKTGSTYLQHFFEVNRFTLLEQGIYYPEFGVFWQENRPHKQAGHNGFRQEANLGKSTLLNKLMSVINCYKGIHTVVLSSEAYYLGYDDILPMLKQFNNFDIKVITYFREPIEWANSQYCEFVAGGAIGKTTLQFESWLRQKNVKKWLNYKGFIELLSEAVGSNNVIVKKYDRKLFPNGNLIEDFFAAVGFDFSSEKLVAPPKDTANDGNLTTQQVELMRTLNKLPFANVNDYLAFVEEYQNFVKSQDNGKKEKASFVTESSRAFIDLVTADSNEYMRNIFNIEFSYSGISEKSELNSVNIDILDDVIEIYANYSVSPTIKNKVGQSIVQKSVNNKKEKIKVLKSKSASKFECQYKHLTENFSYMNFGFFGWRKTAIKLLVKCGVVKVSKENKSKILNDEFLVIFDKLSKNKIGYVNFMSPLRSVYGVLNWRSKQKRFLYKVIYKLKGRGVAEKFKKSPVVFSRKLQNPLIRLLFRLLYPYGEVVK